MIKEPHGSIAAPLLMAALPESRMVFMIRDPRDVVASRLDAHKMGGWTRNLTGKSGRTYRTRRRALASLVAKHRRAVGAKL